MYSLRFFLFFLTSGDFEAVQNAITNGISQDRLTIGLSKAAKKGSYTKYANNDFDVRKIVSVCV